MPTPLSAEQLYEQSDVIAKAKVLGVAAVQSKVAKIEDRYGYDTKKYQAWLKVLKATKGKVQDNHTVIVTWDRVSSNKKIVGNWEVNYYPNEELITHLVWDNQEKTYRTLSWNSAKTIKSSKNKLPADIGEVNLASD